MPLVDIAIRDRTAVLTIDRPPVNALSRELRGALLEALAAVQADAAASAIVLRGAGKHFIAGADIQELDRGLEPPHTPEVVAAVEGSRKPVVAALSGHALGGGLEIALGCAARVASEKAVLGFPEVRLGLLPGAGGTQRLPRVVGIERALELMTSGRSIPASEATELGLVDTVVAADKLVATAIEHAQALAVASTARRIRDLAMTAPATGFFDQYAARIADRTRGQLAPGLIVQCVANALEMPFEQGLAAERALFLRCLASPQSRALRYAFFAERAARKWHREDPSVPAASSCAESNRAAVIGAGTMGADIAYCLLCAGFRVVLHDRDAAAIERATRRIDALAEAAVAKRKLLAEDRRLLAARLSATSDLGAVGDARLVIEAVFEDLALKQSVFADLDAQCSSDAVLATNTSTLDVDAIAAATSRPERVLGLHFFSPASVMRLVEVVRGARTADRTIAMGLDLVARIGKLGVVVGNAHGFVGNRLYHAYQREAQALLLEGAQPADIDQALRDWGMAMGPHAVSDLAGLDVGYRIRRQRPAMPDDPGYFRVADKLVEAGRLGQKTGRGLYRYEPGSHVPIVDPDVSALIEREAAELGIARREIAAAEIIERCMLALVVEGAGVLERGVAQRASDIDVIWLTGYGFPRHRGGPMHFADELGLAHVIERIRALAAQLGDRYWQVPALLDSLAQSGAQLAEYEATTRI